MSMGIAETAEIATRALEMSGQDVDRAVNLILSGVDLSDDAAATAEVRRAEQDAATAAEQVAAAEEERLVVMEAELSRTRSATAEILDAVSDQAATAAAGSPPARLARTASMMPGASVRLVTRLWEEHRMQAQAARAEEWRLYPREGMAAVGSALPPEISAAADQLMMFGLSDDRPAVERALLSTGGDMDTAANMILSGQTPGPPPPPSAVAGFGVSTVGGASMRFRALTKGDRPPAGTSPGTQSQHTSSCKNT